MPIYVYQDGAEFYVYSDKECETLLRIETAPIKVTDFDVKAAMKARDWFNEYGHFKGATQVIWVPIHPEGF